MFGAGVARVDREVKGAAVVLLCFDLYDTTIIVISHQFSATRNVNNLCSPECYGKHFPADVARQ
jgi:hypothetical protein